MIDYSLPKKLEADEQQKALHQTPVKIEIRDASGELIATRYGEAGYGVNRYVWDMRYDKPTATDFEPQPLEGKPPAWAQTAGPGGPAGHVLGQRHGERPHRDGERARGRRPQPAARRSPRSSARCSSLSRRARRWTR